jgi:hypothetical protein
MRLSRAPGRPGARGLALAIALTAALVLSGAAGRLVRLEGLPEQTWLWLWAWQDNRVEFVNSVTSRPVRITFGTPWHFSGFVAQTDPGTEEYYTGGLYAWNERLALESARRIHYCSEVGVSLVLGGRVFHKRGGCLSASLVWPP